MCRFHKIPERDEQTDGQRKLKSKLDSWGIAHSDYDASAVNVGHWDRQRDHGTEQNNGKTGYTENIIASATYCLQRDNKFHTAAIFYRCKFCCRCSA